MSNVTDIASETWHKSYCPRFQSHNYNQFALNADSLAKDLRRIKFHDMFSLLDGDIIPQ